MSEKSVFEAEADRERRAVICQIIPESKVDDGVAINLAGPRSSEAEDISSCFFVAAAKKSTRGCCFFSPSGERTKKKALEEAKSSLEEEERTGRLLFLPLR